MRRSRRGVIALTLTALEGAGLTALATISAYELAYDPFPSSVARLASLAGLAFAGFLGYSAYKTPIAVSSPAGP